MKRILSPILILSLWIPTAHQGQTISTAGVYPVGVLLIVAHPHHEYEMAGTVYRIAKELSGTVDQIILAAGEAGYRYSSLADKYYRLDLADESVGRKQLPRIRREEAEQAGRILGIRHQWFLNQKDAHYTLSAEEVLEKSWNRNVILRTIVGRLREGHYDFAMILRPTLETHGEHKAAPIYVAGCSAVSAGATPDSLGCTSFGKRFRHVPATLRVFPHGHEGAVISVRSRCPFRLRQRPFLPGHG
jgi:hypothetical protein